MFYNYSPLWSTLKRKGLSRKQLREVLQISPATMARMSAGEPIATETLGRICDLLQCSLDKIFTISPKQNLPGHWATIDNTNADKKPRTFRME
jgi:DNA-binding Xre family transcriptional regulator